jgi:hypothetical protein
MTVKKGFVSTVKGSHFMKGYSHNKYEGKYGTTGAPRIRPLLFPSSLSLGGVMKFKVR